MTVNPPRQDSILDGVGIGAQRVLEEEGRLAELRGVEDRLLGAATETEELRQRLETVMAARRAERAAAAGRISELERLHAVCVGDRSELQDLRQRLESLAAELVQAADRTHAADSEIAALRQELADRPTDEIDRRSRLARLEDRVARQAEALADREARIAYLTGGKVGGEGTDDLTRIWGIGPTIERSLREMGIVSFRQIAELTGPQLPEVRRALGSFQDRVERDAWSAQARRLLEGEDPIPDETDGPTDALGGPEPDDLTRIWGIGPAIERTLHGMGIVSFRQIAELAGPRLDAVREALGIFRNRIENDAWMDQARLLRNTPGTRAES